MRPVLASSDSSPALDLCSQLTMAGPCGIEPPVVSVGCIWAALKHLKLTSDDGRRRALLSRAAGCSGNLSLASTVALLCKRPWCQLLPAPVARELSLLNAAADAPAEAAADDGGSFGDLFGGLAQGMAQGMASSVASMGGVLGGSQQALAGTDTP